MSELINSRAIVLEAEQLHVRNGNGAVKLKRGRRAKSKSDLFPSGPVGVAPFTLSENGNIQLKKSADITVEPRLAYGNKERGIFVYQGNSLEFLDAIAEQYPEGRFDTIFADPPYFLSNGGITCHAGRMVKVDKGNWDKSRGADLKSRIQSQRNGCDAASGFLKTKRHYLGVGDAPRHFFRRICDAATRLQNSQRHRLGKAKSTTKPFVSVFYAFYRNSFVGCKNGKQQTRF